MTVVNHNFAYDDENQLIAKWPNRDPLGELGFEVQRRHQAFRNMRSSAKIAELSKGADLYEFVTDNPITLFDAFGLYTRHMSCLEQLKECDDAASDAVSGPPDENGGGGIEVIIELTICKLLYNYCLHHNICNTPGDFPRLPVG